MKKVMFAAAVAAGMVAFGDAIESSNIVGYQDIPIPAGYSMYTVTFKNPSTTTFDIKDIVVCNAEGTVMDDSSTALRSRSKIQVQKLNASTGSIYEDTYTFNSRYHDWYVLGGEALVSGTVVLGNAEGLYINNGHDATMKLRVSGEVVLTPVSSQIPEGYSIIGNMTPATIDLKSIVVLDNNGVVYDDSTTALRSRSKVQVQKLNSTTGSLYEETYTFNSRYHDWYVLGGDALTANQVTLAPGESLYVNNGHNNVIYFRFPSPVSGN